MDDGAGSSADDRGSMDAETDNDVAEGVIPQQGSATGDVDPKPDAPRDTQRHPARHRQKPKTSQK